MECITENSYSSLVTYYEGLNIHMTVVTQAADYFAHNRSFPLQRIFWRIWYESFALWFADAGIGFMNYGYAELDQLEKEQRETDQPLRAQVGASEESLSLNLYHKVASAVSLSEKEVLEVGCGRGGGAAYVCQQFSPSNMTGVDFSSQNIKICNRQFSQPGLSYQVGDAENLDFDDQSFDAIINVESSHCYNEESKFFSEVSRVLRPGGHFLFTDFRPMEKLSEMEQCLKDVGLELIERQEITKNVLRSLDIDDERKLEIVHGRERERWFFKQFLVGASKCFAGNKGTPIYKAFEDGSVQYVRYVLKKA